MCEAIERLRSVQPLDINACTALQYSTALVYNTYIIEDNGNTETFLLPDFETGRWEHTYHGMNIKNTVERVRLFPNSLVILLVNVYRHPAPGLQIS